ncbi:MAG: thymidine phosphorylase, partial [Christensenellaceae bacterium]|nr:thymidine phosphorylase [Christensenellaceae bacterium]
TGGVGDTTSLILAPLVAACGIPVAKMSGRGLGHTGGTLDKLESIPGMSINLSDDQFKNNIKSIGLAIIGQTGNLAPADKTIYALRDVTSTVDSIPLIASSIMSKKIAGGAKAIVLDVKTGNGAIVNTLEESIELAKTMVQIGELANRPVIAVISSMEEPLGSHVGNALEVKEAIDVLAGRTKGELLEVSLYLASYMLLLSGKYDSFDKAYKCLEDCLYSGEGLKKLKQMIIAQGGDGSVCDDVSKLPQSKYSFELKSNKEGYIESMDTMQLGYASQALGAGRQSKTDVIDPSVGFVLHKRIGDKVNNGDIVATIFYNKENSLDNVKQLISSSIKISNKIVSKPKLVLAVVDSNGIKMM